MKIDLASRLATFRNPRKANRTTPIIGSFGLHAFLTASEHLSRSDNAIRLRGGNLVVRHFPCGDTCYEIMHLNGNVITSHFVTKEGKRATDIFRMDTDKRMTLSTPQSFPNASENIHK